MSPRSTLHNPVSYRTAGVLLVLSGVLVALGQTVGIMRWRGMYSLTENRPGDLLVSQCSVLRDDSGVRYACNPVHTFSLVTVVLSGLAVIAAAVLMVVTARRLGDRGVIGTASLLGLSGLLTVAVSFTPVEDHALTHDILLLVYLVSVWAAMEVLVDSATRHAETTGDAHPLIYGAYVPVTRVMEFFSIVGALTLIFSGRNVMPGAFERVAVDTLTLWILVFGVGLFSLGGAADRERMRVAEMERQHREGRTGIFGAVPQGDAASDATDAMDATVAMDATALTNATAPGSATDREGTSVDGAGTAPSGAALAGFGRARPGTTPGDSGSE